jgi:hypothetical protein
VFDYVAVEYGAEGIRRLVFALRTQNTLAGPVPAAFEHHARSVRRGVSSVFDGEIQPALTG